MTIDPVPDAGAAPGSQFPLAEIRRRLTFVDLVRGSRLWWLTLACLVVALLVAWRATRPTGPTLLIHFPDGHGLRVGDAMRHRGIEVGTVDEVDLAPDLSGVDVTVVLSPAAEALARADSQFWIVRPRVSLEGVSGLETAIGAKYIAVRAADPAGPACREFTGLASAPADELGQEGIEVILRASDSHGLAPGAPVLWRGVTVGEVLAVDLAADTRYVDVRARVDATYRRLVRPNSQFWFVGGLDINAGLTGIRFKTESLVTIARGGVAFITPSDGAPNEPVEAGHVFTLNDEPRDEWLADASTVGLVDFALPPTVTIRTAWQQRRLAITLQHDRLVSGLLVTADPAIGGDVRLLGPTDGVTQPDGAIEGSWRLDVLAPGTGNPIFTLPEGAKFVASAAGVCGYALRVDGVLAHAAAQSRLRVADAPEDCLLVRSVGAVGQRSSLVHSISRTQISVADDAWQISGVDESMSDWHGAAVVAATDGAVIGLFLDDRTGPIIAPLSAALFE
ncbi:MAG: MCE family protein [Planctomycetales bacterium]|nr:MCE family protein [Planctomycetales bacterium]